MSNSTPQLDILIADQLDGELTAVQHAELEGLLRDDPAARGDYARLVAMHALLDSELNGQLPPLALTEQPAAAGEPVDIVVDPWLEDDAADITPLPRRIWQSTRDFASDYMVLSLVTSGLVITTIVLSLALWTVPEWRSLAVGMEEAELEFVARVVKTKNARWSTGSEISDNRITDLYAGQTVELESGLAEILFDSGARVVLEAPSTFRLRSDERSELLAGRLVAHVPPQAVGFTVDSPLVTVVDLGTEFAIDVTAGATEVHVFEGAAAATTADAGQPLKLSAGEAVRFSSRDSGVTMSERIRLVRNFTHKIEPATQITGLLGADTGEGLDLDGDVVYAINFGGPTVVVGDLTFAGSDEVANMTISVDQSVYTWNVAVGDSDDDRALSEVLSSLSYSTAPRSVVMELPVQVGQEYRLQLPFLEGLHRNREFRIAVNGTTIVPRLTLNPGKAVVVKHQFIADSDMLVIEYGAVEVPGGRDPNPILPALVVEKISENLAD